MYISSDTSKFLNLIYHSYHFKPLYSKELKERIVSIVQTEIEALNRNLIGFSFIKELDKDFVFKDGVLFQIREEYFLRNKDFLINSFNPLWFSKKEIKKSKNKTLMKLKLYLFLLKEDDNFFLKLMLTKSPLILEENFKTGRYLENDFYISSQYKEKTILKKLSNVEFDEKEWEEFKKGFIEIAKLYSEFKYTLKRLRTIYNHQEDCRKELLELGLEKFIVDGQFVLPSEELDKYEFVVNSRFNRIKEHLKLDQEILKRIENFQ